MLMCALILSSLNWNIGRISSLDFEILNDFSWKRTNYWSDSSMEVASGIIH
jgi:hypothetical protein